MTQTTFLTFIIIKSDEVGSIKKSKLKRKEKPPKKTLKKPPKASINQKKYRERVHRREQGDDSHGYEIER